MRRQQLLTDRHFWHFVLCCLFGALTICKLLDFASVDFKAHFEILTETNTRILKWKNKRAPKTNSDAYEIN